MKAKYRIVKGHVYWWLRPPHGEDHLAFFDSFEEVLGHLRYLLRKRRYEKT